MMKLMKNGYGNKLTRIFKQHEESKLSGMSGKANEENNVAARNKRKPIISGITYSGKRKSKSA